MGQLDPALLRRPASALGAAVRAGEVRAADVVAASLDRIAALDGRVGAFVDVWADEAREAAASIEPGDRRPFAGVPIAIKANRAVAGHAVPGGSAFTGSPVAEADDHVVARLRAAGFVPVGATNLPEFAIQPVTRPRAFGATATPWDLGRSAGGSSGGSAAAVAAGMVPVAHGNDGGGSLRTPGAACGLVALKAQRGRVSPAPQLGQSYLATDGLLVRTVADAAATLDAIEGPVLGDASWAPPVGAPFAELLRRGPVAARPGPVRIGVTTEPALGGEPGREELAAVASAAGALAGAGCAVEETSPPWDADRGDAMLDLFATAFGPGAAAGVRAAERRRGVSVAEGDVEGLTWWLWERALALPSVDLLLAGAEIQALGRAIVTWADPFDAVLMPALTGPPPPIDALDPDDPDPEAVWRAGGRFNPYAPMANVSGSPAIVLPWADREDREDGAGGPPVAVQLVGRPGGEGPLLALAARLEALAPVTSTVAPLARG